MSGRDEEDGGSEPFRPGGKTKSAAPPPNRVAEKILAEGIFVQDRYGTVYRYNGRFWAEATEAFLLSLALRADGDFHSVNKRRAEIVSFVKAKVHDPDFRWGRVADHEVPCESGVVDLLTGALRPHCPEDYIERIVPWPYEAGAEDQPECPVWRQCLIDWFGETSETGLELAAALQEFAGYILLPHARFKKALMIHGEGDTAKSLIVYALQQLAGMESTCSLSVEDMDDPTRRAVLKGKSLNVMTELGEKAMIRDGGFKTLVATEEPILIDQKYKAAEMYVPTAKHVIATNYLPRLSDQSKAMFNRLLLIPLERVFEQDEQDRSLKEKLTAEMPAIFLWAMEGAKRLIERGGEWPRPIRSEQLLAEYRRAENPLLGFIEERMLADLTAATSLRAVTSEFNIWNGGRKLSVIQAGKFLRRAGFATKKVRLADEGSVQALVAFKMRLEETGSRFTVDGGAAASAEEEIDAQH